MVTPIEETWCRKCDGLTEHVRMVEHSIAYREIDGDSLVIQTPILYCLTCKAIQRVPERRTCNA